MTQKLGMTGLGECRLENILAGDYPRSTAEVTLAGGTVYPMGAALGRVTATGDCVLVDSSKADGSEKLYAILCEQVDATDGDAVSVGYLTGEFVEQRIVFGGADTADAHRDAARDKGIFFLSGVVVD